MGNINTYGLAQMKRILGDTGSSNDTVYLGFLHAAVEEVESSLHEGLSVTVTDSSYVLAPDPGAASSLWHVLACCAIWLYRKKQLDDFLDDLQGLSSVRDDVTAFNRGPTMQIKQSIARTAKAEYIKARYGYSAVSDVVDMEEMGLRESVLAEEDE